MKPLVNIFLALLCISVFCQAGGATILHVPLPYATIQAAVNAAVVGDTVLVDEGTYKENILITKKITVGSLFIVDGDTAHISRTIIDGSQPSNPKVAAVVTIDGATDTTTVVAGFTLTGGKGNLRTVNYPPITYETIVGMGVDIAGGGARIHHNIVRANYCSAPTTAVGGVINIFDVADQYGISYAIVECNSIVDNTVIGANVGGGAIAIGHSSTIRGNVIARNTALGVSSLGSGAALNIWNGLVKIERNQIINNWASYGGGALYANAIPQLNMAPNIEMVNNIIADNFAGGFGGGLLIEVAGATVLMVNNTLVSNTAGMGAGLAIQSGATVRALNTILWDSSASEVVTATGGSFTASYCDVAGGVTGIGNINADPGFFSSHGDSLCWFHGSSSCANAGVMSASVGGVVLTAPSEDCYGHFRPIGAAPDIGAFEDGPWSGVENIEGIMPTAYVLHQNYPNPFNPRTVVSCQLPVASDVRLVVCDILGREVAVLLNERKAPGRYTAEFDASGLASGIYFYHLTAGKFEETRKMVLLK
jgi:hypothetical protein